MTMRIAYALLVAMLFAWFPAHAAEPLAVITAATNPLDTLSLDTLKLIYLRKSQMDTEGNRWIPLNLSVTDPLRRSFSLALFSVLPEEQDDYWNVQYFNGISPPKVMASEEAILRFVASTTGSIGYVHKRKADSRVKVLLLISPPTAK
jgi:ABC-type phosphate transport system substrate-binding protein